MATIDLNADVGEVDLETDARIMAVVSSVSIACGGHAGDDHSMLRTATLASHLGLRIGAHPSYVDRAGFGRTRIDVPPAVLRTQIRDQIERLAANSPAPIAYVKPHGALYHAAAHDPDVAWALVEAADGLPLMGQAGALYLRLGNPAIHEAFADRAYAASGQLVPRSHARAVLHAERSVLQQVTDLAQRQVRTIEGTLIPVLADSICLHSDTPGAADLAHRIADHLRSRGIEVRA